MYKRQEESYPAVADVALVNTLNETIADYGKRVLNGISCTMDGFYSQMHDSRFSKEWGIDMQRTFDELRKLHVSGCLLYTSAVLKKP